MGSKREEERNEKIIRGLMKLPPNRRCINCNTLGLRSYEDETRRANSYHSYSQSPPYDFQYEERRYGKHAVCLTRKPGSDRGLYGAKLSSFSSPSRFSDHANDEGFANEGSHPRVLEYSASSGSDPFRCGALSAGSQRDIGSPFSETSSNFSNKITGHHTVLHNSDAISGSKRRHSQALDNGGNVRIPDEVEPLSSLSSHFNMVLHDVPVAVAGLSSVAADCKPTNPFDLSYDADLESSYMTPFRDMSSLQAALPNNQMMAPYDYVGETNWFPQNSVPSYVPGGAPFDAPGASLLKALLHLLEEILLHSTSPLFFQLAVSHRWKLSGPLRQAFSSS
ncbi:UNVERIFIED_CONTAM: putative ADP-ribosylation factor GTPase-activating protein AGD14 [Sesamum indicum]